MKATTTVQGLDVVPKMDDAARRVLTPDALAFLASLHRKFEPTRQERLADRRKRQAEFDKGVRPDFLASTKSVREGEWKVKPAPKDLQDRRVEITGPVDRKMIINALNSGAKVYMADFEDSHAPTWQGTIEGQANLMDAIDGTIELRDEAKGKVYKLGPKTATLLVRPRGWHLVEKHVKVDGTPISASLFDFGLYFFHNAQRLAKKGSGPYFYLPKMESHLEARLWNDVFNFAQDHLKVPRGTIKVTVLIETILAAFEMEEILYELRDHIVGLNAGRWDYIFSIIKKFRNRPDFVLPDRGLVTMTVPFMRAYTQLLIKTCHKRGAHAMGGMSAFIPNRRDPDVTERALTKVREDKVRESKDGHDGTWVAHPDLVTVAMEIFDQQLGKKANQVDRQRDDVKTNAKDLLNVRVEGGAITEEGVRGNIDVGIRYLESWLGGSGAAAIHNLMEDAATAEISRSQIWQWARHGAKLKDGRPVTKKLVQDLAKEELAKIRKELGDDRFKGGHFDEARKLFEKVALADDFPEFLTLPAYDYLD